MRLDSEEKKADNKILLLYVLNKIGKPISHNELLELVTSVIDINYFIFQEFLSELNDDNYLTSYKKDGLDIYEITDEGKKTLALTIDTVPGLYKLQVDSKFKENLDTLKDKYSISAEYVPINDREYTIKLKINENTNTIFDLSAHAGSKDQAKKLVDNWNNNAEYIYPKILELLFEENDNDKK